MEPALKTSAIDETPDASGEVEGYLSRAEALRMLRRGRVAEWNEFRDLHPEWVHDSSEENAQSFEGANLGGAELAGVNLRFENLSGANLRSADLSGADLRFADLSGANLRLAVLHGAKLDRANLTGADLRGADLRDADVTGVIYDRRKMRHRFQGVRGIGTCYGNMLFKRDANDQDYIDTLEDRCQGTPRRWLFRLWTLIDYGRSIARIGIGAAIIAFVFGTIFLICQLAGAPLVAAAEHTPQWWFTSYYYSVVTYTTLGYGDVSPMTPLGQVLVMIEVVLGYMTLGLLMAVLANTVVRRA